MNALEEIHSLIRSLTPSEKRYFKRYAERHVVKGGNNYYRIFTFLNSRKKVSRERFIAFCRENDISGNISAEKKYLQEKLMESMRQLHDKAQDHEIADLKFLYAKGLFEIFEKKYPRSRQQILDQDIPENILPLLQLEKQLIRDGKGYLVHKDILAACEEEGRLLQQLQEINDLTSIRIRMLERMKIYPLKLQDNEPEIVTKLKEQVEQQYREDEISTVAIKELYFFYGNYYSYHGEYRTAVKYFKQLIALFDERQAWIKQMPSEYRKAIGAFLNNCFHAHKYQDIEEYLSKLHNAKCSSSMERAENIQHFHHLQILYLLNTGKLEQLLDIQDHIITELEEYGYYLNKNRLRTIYYNLFVANFVVLRFHTLPVLLEEIVRIRGDLRADLAVNIRFFHIILHYEQRNFKTLPVLLKRFKQYLRSREENILFSAEIIALAEALTAAEGDSGKVGWQHFRDIFSVIRKDAPNIPGLDEILLWLQSKVENITMEELYKKEH